MPNQKQSKLKRKAIKLKFKLQLFIMKARKSKFIYTKRYKRYLQRIERVEEWNRKVFEEEIGSTYNQFVTNKYSGNSVAAVFMSIPDDTDALIDLHDRRDYFFTCFQIYTHHNELNSLYHVKREIQKLFIECIKHYSITDRSVIWPLFIDLAELLTEANVDIIEKKQLNNSLASHVESFFESKMIGNFDKSIRDLISWYEFLIDYKYHEQMGIEDCSYFDLEHLFKITTHYYEELELFKGKRPLWYIRFVDILVFFYKRSKELDFNYKNQFELRMITSYSMLSKINICKSVETPARVSDAIYNYEKTIQSEKRNKFLHKFLLFTIGFGERPSRLLYVYLIIQLFYLLIISRFWDTTNFNGTPSNSLIEVLFYNITLTMVGFADITPKTHLLKLITLSEEILGFVITGSFIALVLRKWFRQ